MPTQRMVTIAAGAGYTDIPVTIPCHYMKIYEDGDRTKDLEYTLLGDGHVQVYRTKDGDAIELMGPGRVGLLGRPEDYNAVGAPAMAEVPIKVRTQDAAGTDVIVYESESEL